ncbi:hypothetical protein EMPS_06909 [Entomortierella parvispora]|uniref:Uncharacterized protein n=1 Tax=Entomortierella parvispora TaxID=205924 RepID=A0A9P3HDE1_9FUNG|nr:hypothetical protein EMPS_06909 [Entomortierella parvispora]
MEIDTAPAAKQQATPLKLTRFSEATESYYIYLTVEMDSQHDGHSAKPKSSSKYELSIMTFRRMLSSAVQDLFGATMGGGINIDILGYWTDAKQDPYNRLATSIPPPTSIQSSNIPADTTAESSSSQSTTAVTSALRKTATVKWTHVATTAASAVLRCHASDLNHLWNSLTLFNTLVDESEARFEVRYVSGTLLGLQANSRQMQWV